MTIERPDFQGNRSSIVLLSAAYASSKHRTNRVAWLLTERWARKIAVTGTGGAPLFVASLSDENCGEGSWMPGWRVQTLDGDHVSVHRAGLTLRAETRHSRTTSGGALITGAQVDLQMPKEQLGISPGYYMVISDRPYFLDPGKPRVRVYWHVSAGAGQQLVREISEKFNRSKLAFRFKILNDPTKFNRCDSAVLYFYRADYTKVRALLPGIYDAVLPWLRPVTPPFTKLLAGGLALTEDPVDGSSFGVTRCELVAEGLVRAYENKVKTPEERLNTVREVFLEKDIPLETTFLNPGSTDIYAINGLLPALPAQPVITEQPGPRSEAGNDFMGAACDVGDRLCEAAYQQGDRCTWMSLDLVNNRLNNGREDYVTIGPSLYDGTAGVALFLSELGHASRRSNYRDLALRAINQSIARISDVPQSLRIALYTGHLGVALAAARIGTVNEIPHLVQTARQLADSTLDRADTYDEFDITNGLSGAILALLALTRMCDTPRYLDQAMTLGNRLLSLASHDDRGASWLTPGQHHDQHNLTGYSHGAAGVCHALLELFAATGNDAYRTAAELAVAYEDSWLSGGYRNWPDFRGREDTAEPGEEEFPSMTAWCHGAPGIAISRVRAYGILGCGYLAEKAEMALETTADYLQNQLQSQLSDVCLCHGLLGNAEILSHCSRLLTTPGRERQALADGVYRSVMHRYLMDHGSAHERVGKAGPGIMMGISGIGYAFLRRCNDSPPSILDISDWN